jgi:hypothetical protein
MIFSLPRINFSAMKIFFLTKKPAKDQEQEHDTFPGNFMPIHQDYILAYLSMCEGDSMEGEERESWREQI